MNKWYRNAGHKTAYHQARADWVRSGKAICGASIATPGYVCDNPINLTHKVCKRCRLKMAKVPASR
jgi:hypothetical protein